MHKCVGLVADVSLWGVGKRPDQQLKAHLQGPETCRSVEGLCRATIVDTSVKRRNKIKVKKNVQAELLKKDSLESESRTYTT